jgi:tRNA-dihydrouridine synthase B
MTPIERPIRDFPASQGAALQEPPAPRGIPSTSRLPALPFGNGHRVNFPVLVAPMVGISHVAFRALVRSYLPEGASTLLFTEMLSSRRLPSERVGRTPITYVLEGGEPDLVPQLLANEERFIRESMGKLGPLSPAGVDINMGCPVKKALSHNWGVALMGDIGYASEVVAMARRHVAVPLSVKMRSGLTENLPYLLEFIQAMEASGADWVTLHPRLQAQGRRGRASWETISRAREAVKIPLVGNGDVQTSEGVLAMFRETGCDGVMVARAATARPWIFWQVGEELGFPPPPGRSGERAPRTPEEEGKECERALRFFLEQLERWFVPEEGIRRLRFFVAWSHKWLPFGHHLWAGMTRVSDYASARATLERFFATPHRMLPRTSL